MANNVAIEAGRKGANEEGRKGGREEGGGGDCGLEQGRGWGRDGY